MVPVHVRRVSSAEQLMEFLVQRCQRSILFVIREGQDRSGWFVFESRFQNGRGIKLNTSVRKYLSLVDVAKPRVGVAVYIIRL
jgi:hypothetical protein